MLYEQILKDPLVIYADLVQWQIFLSAHAFFVDFLCGNQFTNTLLGFNKSNTTTCKLVD